MMVVIFKGQQLNILGFADLRFLLQLPYSATVVQKQPQTTHKHVGVDMFQ